MSSTWNGSALQTRFSQKYGLLDSTSLLRVLEWMNEIQRDIADKHNWPVYKFKMKKQISADAYEVDLSPQIPSAPTLALLAGGSLTADSAVYLKVTFVLFDADGREMQSIESEPSAASNTVTPTGGNLSLTVTNIDTYDGSSTAQPTTIHRRLYLRVGTGNYLLAKTLSDNTTTTTTITANTSEVIEPPEGSLVKCLADEGIVIESSGHYLRDVSLDQINQYDPNNTSSGTPAYVARTGDARVRIYPRPSSAITLSYWVYRYPSRVFADTARVLQLPEAFKPVFDAGMTWKFYEYKDQDGQESKLSNYDIMLSKKINSASQSSGLFPVIRRVC